MCHSFLHFIDVFGDRISKLLNCMLYQLYTVCMYHVCYISESNGRIQPPNSSNDNDIYEAKYETRQHFKQLIFDGNSMGVFLAPLFFLSPWRLERVKRILFTIGFSRIPWERYFTPSRDKEQESKVVFFRRLTSSRWRLVLLITLHIHMHIYTCQFTHLHYIHGYVYSNFSYIYVCNKFWVDVKFRWLLAYFCRDIVLRFAYL